MFRQYNKPSIKSIQSKKKQQQLQQQQANKKPAPKPEWNTSSGQEDKYKLSQAEVLQKKISLVSKHRIQAKEEWQERQRKLQEGILDEETEKIYETAKDSKNLNIPSHLQNRKNLSQMIDFNRSDLSNLVTESSVQIGNEENDSFHVNINKTSKQPRKLSRSRNHSQSKLSTRTFEASEETNMLSDIQQKVQKTREFINKMDSCSCKNNDPVKVLKAEEYAEKKVQNQPKKQQQIKNKSFLTENFSKISLNKPNETINSHQSQQNLSENNESSASVNIKPNSKELDVYFKSLSKIEDTIKFMENNIIKKEDSPQKTNQIKEEQQEESSIFESDQKPQNLQQQQYKQQQQGASSILKNNFFHEKTSTQNDELSHLSFTLTEKSFDNSAEKSTNLDKQRDIFQQKSQLQQEEFESIPISEIKQKQNFDQKQQHYQDEYKNLQQEYSQNPNKTNIFAQNQPKNTQKHVHFPKQENEFLIDNPQNSVNQDFSKPQQIKNNNLFQPQTQQQQQQFQNEFPDFRRNTFEQQQEQSISEVENHENSQKYSDIISHQQSEQKLEESSIYDENLDINRIRDMLEQTKTDLQQMNTTEVNKFSNLQFNNTQKDVKKPEIQTQISKNTQKNSQSTFTMVKNPQDVVHIDSVAQNMEFLLSNTIQGYKKNIQQQQQNETQQSEISNISSHQQSPFRQNQPQKNDYSLQSNINNNGNFQLQQQQQYKQFDDNEEDEEEMPRQFNIIQQQNFTKNLQNYQKKSFRAGNYENDSMSIRKHM